MSVAGRREALVAALVGAAAFLPFLRGAVSGASLYFRDLALYFLPLRRLALDGLRVGEVRFWNPYLHEGVPLSLPAVGYPLDLLQLIRPDEAGISLVLALHVPLAAVGFYALARRLVEAPAAAAAGGALVYALGGFVLSTVNLYVYLEAAAWAPLVILALTRVQAGGGRRTVAGAALVVALALSTTGIEIVAQAVGVGLVLGLQSREGRPATALARAGGALALGALVAAPVLALMASQVADSARGQGFETSVVLAHSIHPFTLLQGLVGGLYGNLANLADEWWGQNFFPRGFPYILSLYVGPAAFALALVGGLSRHGLRTRIVLLALFGLVLCLGRWAGLSFVVDALPAARTLRYPVKAFYTVHLAIALLVSLGLDRLGSAESRRAGRLVAVTAGTLGGLLALAPLLPRVVPATMEGFAAAFFPPGFDPRTRVILLSRILGDAAAGGALALAIAAVAGLASRGALRPARATVLSVAILGADLLRTGAGLNPMVSGSFFRPSPELTSELPSLREGRVFTCGFDDSRAYHEARRAKGARHEAWTFALALETLTPAFNIPLGVPTAMSPDLTMLIPEQRVLSPSDVGCRDPAALLPRLRRAGVHSVVSADPLDHSQLSLRRVLAPGRVAPLGVHLYDVANPLPRVLVASEVVPVGSASEGARRAAEPGFLEAGGVAVEGARATSGARGHAEVVREGTGTIEIAVESDSASALVIRDGWAPGWTARVDGVPAAVRRADGRHRAVAVPAGRNVVEMRYRPRGFGTSLLLGGLALLGIAALALPRPRQGTGGSPRQERALV